MNGRCGSDRGIYHTTCNNSVIGYVIVSPELFRSVIDFNVLTFDPIISYVHKPVCLHLCSNIRPNNCTISDTDIND